jgi:hypothetical protein
MDFMLHLMPQHCACHAAMGRSHLKIRGEV